MYESQSRLARGYHEVRMAKTQEELADSTAEFLITGFSTVMENMNAELDARFAEMKAEVAEVKAEVKAEVAAVKAEVATAARHQTLWLAGIQIGLMVGLILAAMRFWPTAAAVVQSAS